METKEKLINAAIVCFLENGYEKTSISKITERCDITKGAFYHHFKTKDEVFLAAIAEIFGELERWARERIRQPRTFKELLEHFFDYSHFFSKSSHISSLEIEPVIVFAKAVKQFPEMKRKISQMYHGIMVLMEEKIIQFQLDGEVQKDIDPKVLAMHVTVLSEGLLLFAGFTGNELTLSEDGRNVSQNLWKLARA